MDLAFNADEILEIAQRIERNGARFYRQAASHRAESSAKELLLGLAAAEEEHEDFFALMRETLAEDQRGSEEPDISGLMSTFLGAVADGFVFDTKLDPAEKLTGKETLEEILRIAIGLERDSITFYLGLRELVPAWLGSQKVDQVIQEEINHITILNEQLAEVRK